MTADLNGNLRDRVFAFHPQAREQDGFRQGRCPGHILGLWTLPLNSRIISALSTAKPTGRGPLSRLSECLNLSGDSRVHDAAKSIEVVFITTCIELSKKPFGKLERTRPRLYRSQNVYLAWTCHLACQLLRNSCPINTAKQASIRQNTASCSATIKRPILPLRVDGFVPCHRAAMSD